MLYSHKDVDYDELDDNVETDKVSKIAYALPKFGIEKPKKDAIQLFVDQD